MPRFGTRQLDLEGSQTPCAPIPPRARKVFDAAPISVSRANIGWGLSDGNGAPKDVRSRPLVGLAAEQGQYRAQALLGNVLFNGEAVQRQASRGLMWLTLARDNATSAQDKWIIEAHEAASGRATEDERALALTYLERWLKNRRD